MAGDRHRACEHTISEWKMIRFKDNYADEYSTAAIVGEDHATDAMRYLLMSYPNHRRTEEPWIDVWKRQQKLLDTFKKKPAEYAPLLGNNHNIYAKAF